MVEFGDYTHFSWIITNNNQYFRWFYIFNSPSNPMNLGFIILFSHKANKQKWYNLSRMCFGFSQVVGEGFRIRT